MSKPKPRNSRPTQLGSGPTLEDLARVVGVSTATVSRAINTPALVAEATREKVRLAIEETGYVPNLLAGGLASSRSRLVAALVPSIATSIFNETIEAMTRELAAAGYLVVLGLSSENEDEMDRTITSILARRPDGLILTSAESTAKVRRRLQAAGVTVIETWDLPEEPLDVAIGFSHRKVGEAIAGLVIEKDYQRPLVISSDTLRARMRMAGFVAAFEGAGRRAPACDVTSVGPGWLDGRERYAAFLDAGGEADVVVCSSDLVAQGVLIEAMARGLRVPDDVAVIGFGGAEQAAHTYPPLTTVRIDGAAIGRHAAQVLIDRSNTVEPISRRIDVGFEIVVRGSV